MVRGNARHLPGDVVPPLLVQKESLRPEVVGLLLPALSLKAIVARQRRDTGRRVGMCSGGGKVAGQTPRFVERLVGKLESLARRRGQMKRPVEHGESNGGWR